MGYVLGLDIGTSGLKGILLNGKGEVVASASKEYEVLNPKRGYSEQNPEEWYRAAVLVMKEIIKTMPDAAGKIEGISFSGQMHSMVLLDEHGEVVRNAILWNDVRTTKQCEEITEKLGTHLIEITKNKALEGFTLPKILWVQENEPDLWKKTAHFLLPKDYLGYRLTGNIQMEYSDAAGTLMLDVSNREWSKEILNEFNIDVEICPQLVESTAKIGELKTELTEKLGISNSISVFSGGADNPCAAVGAGIVKSNQAMVSIGTSGVFLTYEENGEKEYKGQLHFFNHVIPNAFYSMGVTLSAGSSLNWFKKQFAPNDSFESLLENVNLIEPGSNGLLFAPYISGERTPYTDSDIRGTFLGIDISHTKDHFVRAVLEGITFSLRDSQELMREHTGKSFNQVVSVGGGAKNKDWLQMQADIFNTPIVTLKTEQGPAMGAAMIAAVGLRWYPNFEECSEIFVQIKEEFKPDSAAVKKYESIYQNYRDIYPAIKKISHQLVN